MLGSLRVRLPLIFLAGIVLAGVVTAAIAIRLFSTFAHNQTLTELNREASGIATLYADSINASFGNGKDTGKSNQSQDLAPPSFAAQNLEDATNTQLFWVGAVPFPGTNAHLETLPQRTIDWTSGQRLTFDLRWRGHAYLAVAQPILLSKQEIGAIVVAKRKADLGASTNALMTRLALAALLGVAVAALLAWYLSRRLVKPVLRLSAAADEVAAGNYDTEVPTNAPGELGHLSERFGEMTSRLAEVERMERNFLMSVSHELRTPLTAIRGHVSAVREGVIDDPDLRAQSLAVIEEEAMRLERLVGDVLDLAKLDAHRFTVLQEEVDMEHLVERAFTAYSELARRRTIDYRRELNAHPVVVTDGDRVLQIITNLLSNAFRWTPEGGRVWVELRAENGNVSVAVSDTGPGISAEERERIFRPFWSRDGGGTGLGLAIARELAVAHGGRIELASEPGRGSRFELVLPATQPDG